MPSKKKEEVEPFEAPVHVVRSPEGKVEKLAPAAADILIRKAGYVDENEYQAKLKAIKAAEAAAKEAAKKDAEENS
jgi:hypothetical protein